MTAAVICSETALQCLEFSRLRELLADQTQSEPGCLAAQQLTPMLHQKEIETALTEVDEAVFFLHGGESPALGRGRDLEPILAQAQAAGRLIDVAELLKVAQSLQAMEECRLWFKTAERSDSVLATGAGKILALPELARRLRDSIGSRGELLDSASFELADLRYQVRQVRARIKQLLEGLLTSDAFGACFQDRLVTQRNGRYVVPLKADCRGQVKGFVQDESASGQTLYLEPALVLEDNNRLQRLLREQQREERRILLQLADLVRRDRAVLVANQIILARIDLRFAAARLSRAYGGCRPRLVDEPVVELRQVRHPLLMERDGRFESEAAVAIDLLLPSECRALVISGPNTGGKSVALKTLGLLLLMLRAGLHLPCGSDSRIHLFRRLHIDIGDEQSIAASLSTFSGHLLKLRGILEAADQETLVLLDEAGSGTDPAEGAALIQAVLEHLCQVGAKTVITTHLGQLKHFADARPDIENAAVEFDPQTMMPAFRLRYGSPGASSALTTARRLGLPEKVIQRAIEFLGNKEYDQSLLLEQLNLRRRTLEQELEQLRQARLDAEASQQLRKQQLRQLQDKKREILKRATQQAEELISATESQLKKIRRRSTVQLTPRQAVEEKTALHEAREQLLPFKPKHRRSMPVPVELQPGELVRISALDVEAQVVRCAGDKIQLRVGAKRMWQARQALEQYQPRRFATQPESVGVVTRKVGVRPPSSSLKLIGSRTDEALARLDAFIDDAILHGLSRVDIIHGAGEGILRRAVRDFLAHQRMVTAFYAAAVDQGGDNITIVELKGQ